MICLTVLVLKLSRKLSLQFRPPTLWSQQRQNTLTASFIALETFIIYYSASRVSIVVVSGAVSKAIKKKAENYCDKSLTKLSSGGLFH